MSSHELRIDGRRFKAAFDRMADIGATPGGGVTRLALGDEDKSARDQLVIWLKEVEASVVVDEMGNIFGRRGARDESAAPVMIGSHLDSQTQGGRFDGSLGVLAGLEVLRTLADADAVTARPLILAAWTAEEGARFTPSKLGSGVWSGQLQADWVRELRDERGDTLGEELRRIGYAGDTPCAASPLHAYLELHIEQGPVLDSAGVVIGIPRGVVCLHVYHVYVDGTANQAGPTPMEGRNDALVAAADMVLATREVPSKMHDGLVATVGRLDVCPNASNVIADQVHFTVDIRSWDEDLAVRAWDDLAGSFSVIAEAHGCGLRIDPPWRVGRTEFDVRLVTAVSRVAADLGHSPMSLVSGSGHDSVYLARVAPTAMIFVPSIGGRSHAEVEDTDWMDCEAGAEVLLQSVLAVSRGPAT
jgi:beta-ureidopropionase / N-carbamoyl-L-amino-acid hydrolase